MRTSAWNGPRTERSPHLAKQPMPTESEIQAFLEQLRRYRASLNTPEQQLLDALVAAGLGREREDHESEVGTYWVADWPTTPWGTTHRRRETRSK